MTRGRKPGLTMLPGGLGERPEPPEGLTVRQAVIWRETVATEAADFFGSAALRHLLADYCRNQESAELLSAEIGRFKPAWLKSEDGAKRYGLLLKMREGETRTAVLLATKLRITNQSRRTAGAAGTANRHAPKGMRPWEPDGAA